ncbi:hypothetical protein CTM86_10160 [Fusobacterium pseudoperiodonticum]|uniref:DUF4252 domain-containing protein n=1 Tax=Fusobacterium pseudoperiodonticum TaxID=2663009 RepID=A0A2D3NNV2_9FUSO|nr:hypothetical protein [Fusobacterium pseudoperiodonticum]MBF1201935.1 hypothetical protein [Fusobacterium periodonticum]ATV57053.1 hypothetical protein CTM68_04695 [Fusobacterium pseudoperiodonticum]ATV59404.1 hypothetical protein CTM72_06450 [Fusobacterium pseudoperiodonticum]ATV66902.1 hypothetical protein CTM86_10160 [Fusobacterium pseudoperiodonticum]ATV68370.1 hypothetical protein CTM92_07010 [Fusobacterium pseudoperiodonticum]
MKKIILGLFLILGAMSFALPKNLDVNKVKKAGYEIARDEDSAVILGKATDDAGITVALFLGNVNAKGVSDSIKATAPKNQKFLSSRETKKAYISKYKDTEYNGFSYSIVAKNSKSKDTVISFLYMTDKELKDADLDKVADKTINEIESFLK